MIPWLVLTMTTPRPPSTRGIWVLVAYTRKPGLLTRLRPDTTGSLPTYLRRRRRNFWLPSLNSSAPSMKPSATRIWAMASFVRDEGSTTSSWRARLALRTRVSMSAIGSETFICLPTRLGHARQLAQQGALAEADAAQGKTAHVGARPATYEAAVIFAHVETLLALRLGYE